MYIYVCMQGLTEMGLTKVAPSNGAFYIYVDTSDAVPDSVSYASIYVYTFSAGTQHAIIAWFICSV
jgi:hypothetical protein